MERQPLQQEMMKIPLYVYLFGCLALKCEISPVACEPPSDEDYQQGLMKKQLILDLDPFTWQVSHSDCINK